MHNVEIRPKATKLEEDVVFGVFNASFCAMDYSIETRDPSLGVRYFAGVNFGSVGVFRYDGVGISRFSRTRRHIISDRNGDLLIVLPLSGRTHLVHAGNRTCCEPGTFRLVSPSIPFFGSCGEERSDQFSEILVRISGACLRQEVPGVDDLLNFSFETRPGPRRIMKSLFELALEEGKNLSVRQSEDFSKMLVGAVSTTLIELSETKGSPARAMPRSEIRVLEAAKSFIANKLSDPTLNSAMVAEHCKVSERYLRRVFSSASWKVSSYIRETRLDKCRLALGNPALRHRPITDIAMSWGFVDPPHFSRAYKSRFDRSPREDRDLLLSRH